MRLTKYDRELGAATAEADGLLWGGSTGQREDVLMAKRKLKRGWKKEGVKVREKKKGSGCW